MEFICNDTVCILTFMQEMVLHFLCAVAVC